MTSGLQLNQDVQDKKQLSPVFRTLRRVCLHCSSIQPFYSFAGLWSTVQPTCPFLWMFSPLLTPHGQCFVFVPCQHKLSIFPAWVGMPRKEQKSTKMLYVESQMALTSQSRLTQAFLAHRSNTAAQTQGSNVSKRGRCCCAGPLSMASRSPPWQQPQQRVGQR